MTDPISFGVLIDSFLRVFDVQIVSIHVKESRIQRSDSHVINIYKHHLKTIFMSSGTKYNKEFKINDINISRQVFKLSNYNIPHEILFIYNYLKKHKWKTSILLGQI